MWMYLFYRVLPFPAWKSGNEKDIKQDISSNNNNIKLSVFGKFYTESSHSNKDSGFDRKVTFR